MQAVDHIHDHSHEHDHDHHHHTHNRWQDIAKTLVLLGTGVYFVYVIFSGNLNNYVNVRFSWLSYVAAALFLILGAASAFDLFHGRSQHHGHIHEDEHDHDHEHDHGHDHTHVSWVALAIVAIPLILGTLVPSEPLGATAVDGNISIKAVAVDSTSAYSKAPLDRNVLDWLREFNKSTNAAAFNGQAADVIGFVYREPSFPKNTFMVARFAISCCVADASAIGLPVVSDTPITAADGDWVEVKGTFQAGDFRGSTTPMLHSAALVKVDQPSHPYLYP